ncbi:MAG TPA: hypothetical protein DEB40_14145 [Elusimicrobia bacterium]|nr:hypothetical protein [Elusimicrobiota bacterium]HBT62873.1 hypothetical protein [Elusimicrobiota bacterium]
MNALFFALLGFFVLGAPSFLFAGPGLESDYPAVLADALLADRELPAAPPSYERYRREAADLAAGCTAWQDFQACRGRILKFSHGLSLDRERTQRLLERFSGGVSGSPGAGPGTRLEDDKKYQIMAAHARSYAAALGVTAYDSAPRGAYMLPAHAPVKAAGTSIRAAPSRGPPPATAAKITDRPIPWSEIRKVVKFGRRPAYDNRALEWAEDALRRIRNPEDADLRAKQLARDAMARMQQTPEGREVLRQLLDEFGKKGKSVLIKGKDTPGSLLYSDKGVETILGNRGVSNYLDYSYSFNRKFLEMKDRSLAVDMLAGNMAHEMRHLVSFAQVERISPEYFKSFTLSLINEQRARQTGYLVAARLSSGKATFQTQEAEALAKDPERFWDMYKGGSYARMLDMTEMRDPLAAYRQRMMVLQEKMAEYIPMIKELPVLNMAMDIMTKKEGLGHNADDLRLEIKAREIDIPAELQKVTDALLSVQSLSEEFQDPKNSEWLVRMKTASKSAAFQRLLADQKKDQEALVQLLQGKRMPLPQPKRDQIGWEEFGRLVKKSQREHPEYWVEFFKRFRRVKADRSR